MTNAERIIANDLTEQEIMKIWEDMGRSAEEWFKWLSQESEEDDTDEGMY